jgi:hypothetical protein
MDKKTERLVYRALETESARQYQTWMERLVQRSRKLPVQTIEILI